MGNTFQILDRVVFPILFFLCHKGEYTTGFYPLISVLRSKGGGEGEPCMSRCFILPTVHRLLKYSKLSLLFPKPIASCSNIDQTII